MTIAIHSSKIIVPPKVTNPEEVLEALMQAKASSSSEELLSSMQVPLDPVKRFFVALYPQEDHN